MRIDVAEFEGSDESVVRQAYAVAKAAHERDVPDIPFEPEDFFVDTVRRGYPACRNIHALATLDGEPAGVVEMSLPLLDNLEQLNTHLNVHPAMRRHGVGRALLDFVIERSRAEGRKHITGESVQKHPDGDAFASAAGAKAALQDTRSRLDLTTADHKRYAEMLAEARASAAGYRVVRWQGMPADEYLDDIAYLDSRLFEDAPMGDLTIEPEKVDADRIRTSEQNRLDRGLDRFHTGAVHEATGRMVAWTTLSGPPALATHLWQHITIVDPDHRGHRLGLIVKLENLRFALDHRPALTAIDTFNASSNEYMLSINRALGFRAADTWMQWQLTI
ncbi:GNAT family N-acetyltransferase [Actinoplanes sp. NPDC049265]|uniref:GNAT family N-acetyltransferase n=1 Tax=Actinoplanes sp. NPDC049265 TaxID=3363902 RepID=UPI00371217F3